ncbi:MAG: hypothetical protein K8I03_05290, partial [Ignavibacteria bacterium]|nr:hypothetical protein [Ignavibacteria bacterium]
YVLYYIYYLGRKYFQYIFDELSQEAIGGEKDEHEAYPFFVCPVSKIRFASSFTEFTMKSG